MYYHYQYRPSAGRVYSVFTLNSSKFNVKDIVESNFIVNKTNESARRAENGDFGNKTTCPKEKSLFGFWLL